MTKLLIELARGRKMGYTLESLVADLKEPKESIEFRMNILEEDFKAYGKSVLDELEVYAASQSGWSVAPNNFEGVRVNLLDGWFLLRMSLHDPLLPLNIESDAEGGAKAIAKELYAFLSTCKSLEMAKLTAYVTE